MVSRADSWFPIFEFQEWSFQSFIILSTPQPHAAPPLAEFQAKQWSGGRLVLGQAFRTDDGYTLGGNLALGPGIELAVSAKGSLGLRLQPAPFEATGIGIEGPTTGSIYELVGWVFPELPIAAASAKVLSIRGSVRAVRGPDAAPEIELGGMPLGTVGSFVIERAG